MYQLVMAFTPTKLMGTDLHWWTHDRAQLPDKIVGFYKQLRNSDERNEAYRTFASLYTNRDISSNSIRSYLAASVDIEGNKYTRVPFNLIKQITDTVVSRVGKMRPRPTFLTEGGNYSLRKRADRLQKWVDMQFYSTKLYQVAPQVFLDACVFGTGIMKVYRKGEEVCAERVYPGELFVDELEGIYGDPRQLFQRKFVPREVLTHMFPEHKEAISNAKLISEKSEYDFGYDYLADQVEVIEAWHLKSGRDADDGRHVMVIEGATLVDEPWESRSFPFALVRWSQDVRGFYGIGLAEELIGIHLDVNTTIEKIERALELTASPQVWVEHGSKVNAQQITNIPGSVNFYSGTPPHWFSPQAVNGEVYNYLRDQINRAYQIAGLSDHTFGGKVPSGLETGQAVRDFHDIETERFSIVSRAYEDFFLELARLFIGVGREIYESNPQYTVVAERDKYTIERVPWSEISMDNYQDSYVLKVFPASSLSSTPAGRKADIQDLLNMQLITPEEGKQLLDFPDIEAFTSLDRATADNIERIIEKILDEGVYEAPEPFMDLQLAIKKAQASVNKAVRMGVPEKNISLLRRFATQCNFLIQRAQREALAAQAAAQVNPAAPPSPGADGAPPTAVTGEEL